MRECMLRAYQGRAELLSSLQSTGPSATNAMQSLVKYCSLTALCLHMCLQAAFFMHTCEKFVKPSHLEEGEVVTRFP